MLTSFRQGVSSMYAQPVRADAVTDVDGGYAHGR